MVNLEAFKQYTIHLGVFSWPTRLFKAIGANYGWYGQAIQLCMICFILVSKVQNSCAP